jgi:hypothetical protein
MPARAAAAAAYLHGIAARLAAAGAGNAAAGAIVAAPAGAPIGSSEIIGSIPAATRTVTAAGGEMLESLKD